MADSVSDNRPLHSWPIEERIAAWRKAAREQARAAQEADDLLDSMRAAALASMYLALAFFAQRFSELPALDDEHDDH